MASRYEQTSIRTQKRQVLWSVKGGSGTTFITTALALLATDQTLLVDFTGDSGAILGLRTELGLCLPWHSLFFRNNSVEDSLEILQDNQIQINENLAYISFPLEHMTAKQCAHIFYVLDADVRNQKIDVGVCHSEMVADVSIVSDAHAYTASEFGVKQKLHGTSSCPAEDDDMLPASSIFLPKYLQQQSDIFVETFFVTRACYLSLRKACMLSFRPTGIILVEEPGRSLKPSDVEDILGVPILASIPYDMSYSRAVDAGTLQTRMPKSLERALHRLTT